MSDEIAARLERLAQEDPTVAPLARLQAVALRAATDPGWQQGVPAFTTAPLERGEPLLHQQSLGVDPARLGLLLDELLERLEDAAGAVASLRDATRRAAFQPLDLLRLSLTQDMDGLLRLASAADVDGGLLVTTVQLLALPLLHACGRGAAAALDGASWEQGFCPVCGAWPLLGELRGLERTLWLRCGRCAAGWRYPLQRCVHCGNDDFRTLGYLAPEDARDSRQAITCDHCRRYLKAVATIQPLSPGGLLLQDLCTLELDMAALEQDYGRPEMPGFRLEVVVAPVSRRSLWFPWRR